MPQPPVKKNGPIPIKAASKKDLQLNREFPESYKSGLFSPGGESENRHRAIYGAMDKIVRDDKAYKNQQQRGVSDKVQSAFSAVGKNSPIKVTAVKKKPVGQSEVIVKKKTIIANPSGGGGRKIY